MPFRLNVYQKIIDLNIKWCKKCKLVLMQNLLWYNSIVKIWFIKFLSKVSFLENCKIISTCIWKIDVRTASYVIKLFRYTYILHCYRAKNNNSLKTTFGDPPKVDLVQRVARIWSSYIVISRIDLTVTKLTKRGYLTYIIILRYFRITFGTRINFIADISD